MYVSTILQYDKNQHTVHSSQRDDSHLLSLAHSVFFSLGSFSSFYFITHLPVFSSDMFLHFFLKSIVLVEYSPPTLSASPGYMDRVILLDNLGWTTRWTWKSLHCMELLQRT